MLKRIISLICVLSLLCTVLLSNSLSGVYAGAESSDWSVKNGQWNTDETAVNATSSNGWNKVYYANTVSADFEVSADVIYSSGANEQYFIYFGAPSIGGNGYSLRVQLSTSAGESNVCVYDDSTNSRKCRWTAFPSASDKQSFNLKLSVKDSVAKVYIDGAVVCTSTALESYSAGYFGFGTYKTAAEFKNIVFTGESNKPEETPDDTPPEGETYVEAEWVAIKNMTVNANNGQTTTDTAWTNMSNPAVLEKDEDFSIETDIKYISGSNHQYFLYFGLPVHTTLANGFSLRIQLSDTTGTNNISIYDDVKNKRLGGWKGFPDNSNKTSFKIKFEVKSGKATVYIDGNSVLTAQLTDYNGGCVGLATYKTGAKFSSIKFAAEKEHKAPKTYIANEDFSDFSVLEHGTQIKGNLSVISSDYTSAKILTDGENKYLSMSRENADTKADCLLQFYDETLKADTYVVQFDASLNENVKLKNFVNLLIGRKNVNGSGVFEYLLRVSENGYIHTTTGALGSTALGMLSSEKFTNIAVVVNDKNRTYSVYLDGVLAIRNQEFQNNKYVGTPDEVQTMFRIALSQGEKDAAIKIDNFKVYTGDSADGAENSEKSITEQFDADFQKLVFTDSRGSKLNYRFYLPKNYDANKKYPVVLAMHGAGLWGGDNSKQLNSCFNLAVSLWHNREKYEAIIVVPQTADKVSWVTGNGNYPWYNDAENDNYDIESFEISRYLSAVSELLYDIGKNYSVDKKRQYVGGFSMGGYATWYLISTYPERFAAALPVCAGSDPEYAKYIKGIPIWTFHSTDDDTVAVEATRKMVEALKNLDGNIKYTEFTDKGHNVWDYAFQSKDVLDWMFAQSRKTVLNRNTLNENVYWKTENPEWITLTTNWKKSDKSYTATGNNTWNKAVLDRKLDNGSFRFETEVKDFNGEQMYIYFGLPDNSKTENGYSVRFQFGESAGNNNVCVYGADNKRKAAWVSFPETSDKHNFKVAVEMSGKLVTVLIDGKIVVATDYLTDYSGGYMGIATNKATATFKNTTVSYKAEKPTGGEENTNQDIYYPKKQNWNHITSEWEEIRNGYSSEKTSGWSKAGFSSFIDKNEDFIFEADISDFKGAERQLYVYFGLSSSYYLDDGYSVRIQFGKDVKTNNIAVYDDVLKKRLARWTAWPETVSKEKFKITLKMVNKRLSVYADDVLLAICNVPEFKGGYCGIATNKSGADVQNVSISFKTDKTNIPDESYQNKTVDLKILTPNNFEKIKLGLYPTNVNGWNKAVSTAPVKGNYKFDADIEYISGKLKQYYFYFALPNGDSLDGGYSVRIQLNDEAKDNNIAVYNDTERKRVSSWVKFPENADKEKFRLTVKLSNNIAVVMIDGKTVCTSTVIEGGTDGYYGVAFNRTSGKLINMALSGEVRTVSHIPATSDSSNVPLAVFSAISSLASIMLILAVSRKNKKQRRLSL
ncbi:MAG: hypothetical protein IKB45_01025 [Clostridia bacterium]|nr:hypothetical protein [Clostridia bacterium]